MCRTRTRRPVTGAGRDAESTACVARTDPSIRIFFADTQTRMCAAISYRGRQRSTRMLHLECRPGLCVRDLLTVAPKSVSLSPSD